MVAVTVVGCASLSAEWLDGALECIANDEIGVALYVRRYFNK